ncbi:thiamine pyrophosphokinase [Pedobacter gandavensis]|uniref:thiamine pyrophosphokinase n=1 Tax=Pedobacter gandavensis TaxID=2679963 RepID=UPI00247AD987|nr:thiamine pyrophosphokinase [Pedobacter gandavensis]WGQ07936.1 thiamine pyrophosphokinase [Pedobacter gandavensis]
MSSHHIVREKQEPALYIHDLGEFNEEYLGQLLEWSPTLIVNATLYEKIVSLGLKVDIVVNPADQEFVQENTKIIPAKAEALDAVLDYLIKEKYSAVNVIDTKAKLRELGSYIDEINIVIFTETEKAYAIKSGFSVWKPKGSVFHIEVLSYFETSNLKQDENGDFVVINDGFVTFDFNNSYLFISEKL